MKSRFFKAITAIIVGTLLFSTAILQASSAPQFFVNKKTDEIAVTQNQSLARSLETKIFTLDMLKKSQDQKALNIYRKLDLRFEVKGKNQSIDSQSKNSMGMIIDPFVKKGTTLEIYNDSDYIEFFKGIERNDILSYLNNLPKGKVVQLFPKFINEAGVYFTNPNFFSAYADYLQTQNHSDKDEIINYLLLGGDYASAADLFDSSNSLNINQKTRILELANRPHAAYEFCLQHDAQNYERLYNLATEAEMHEEAYQNYLKFKPSDSQTLSRISYLSANYVRALEQARKKPLDDEYMLDLFIKTQSYYDALLTAIKMNDSRASHFANKLSDTDKNRAFDYFVEQSDFITACSALSVMGLPTSRLSEIQAGIDEELEKLQSDPDVNHQIVMENTFGKNVTDWTELQATQAKNIRPSNERDLGFYYELTENHAAAYRYYLASHQYIRAINHHHEKLSNSTEQIQDEHYKRAGIEAKANNDIQMAISMYLKAGEGYDQELSDLYRLQNNLDEAISYQLKADPEAYSNLAKLYELNEEFENAAITYIKAKNGRKALENANKVQPINYPLIIDAYVVLDDKTAIENQLNHYYNVDYIGAGAKYIELNKPELYLEKVLADKKIDAVDHHNLYSKINTDDLDAMIEEYSGLEPDSSHKKIVDERLKRYVDEVELMDISAINEAIALSKTINNVQAEKILNEKKNAINKKKQNAKYGTYQGTHPSYSLKGLLTIPPVDYIFKIAKNNQISARAEAHEHYYTDIYGNRKFSGREIHTGNAKYRVLLDNEECFKISFRIDKVFGKYDIVITVDLMDETAVYSSEDPNQSDVKLYKID